MCTRQSLITVTVSIRLDTRTPQRFVGSRAARIQGGYFQKMLNGKHINTASVSLELTTISQRFGRNERYTLRPHYPPISYQPSTAASATTILNRLGAGAPVCVDDLGENRLTLRGHEAANLFRQARGLPSRRKDVRRVPVLFL